MDDFFGRLARRLVGDAEVRPVVAPPFAPADPPAPPSANERP
jgi:hypothetical protein